MFDVCSAAKECITCIWGDVEHDQAYLCVHLRGQEAQSHPHGLHALSAPLLRALLSCHSTVDPDGFDDDGDDVDGQHGTYLSTMNVAV